MVKRNRQVHTREFKEQAVALANGSDRTLAAAIHQRQRLLELRQPRVARQRARLAAQLLDGVPNRRPQLL